MVSNLSKKYRSRSYDRFFKALLGMVWLTQLYSALGFDTRGAFSRLSPAPLLEHKLHKLHKLQYKSIKLFNMKRLKPPSMVHQAPPSLKELANDKKDQAASDLTKTDTVIYRRVDERARSKIKSMYSAAQRELKSGRTQQCLSTLREILNIDSTDSHSWLLLGRTLARTGETEQARKIFSQAAEACPNSVHILQAWAVLEQKYGNTEQARALFNKGLNVDPGNAYVCHAWGLMEQRLDNTQKARELFGIAFLRTPQAQVCTALGELEASAGDMTKAREVFQQGTEQCFDKGHVYMAWARVEEQISGDLELAERLLQAALDVDGKNVKVHIARAQLEMRRGNIVKARDILTNASDLVQKDAQLFNMWAMLEQRHGNLTGALEIIRNARKRFPAEQSLLQTEGTIEERLGNHSRAMELYRESTLIRPTAPAYVAWALLIDKLAGPKKDRSKIKKEPSGGLDGREFARKLFEKGIRADPKHGPLYNAFGSMEARLGNVSAAKEIFRRGVAAHCTDMASVWHGLGSVELRQGNVSMARQLFTRAMSEATQTEDVSFLSHSLGVLELSMHNSLEARSAFAAGLGRCPMNSPLLLGAALAEVKLGCITEAREFFKRAVVADRLHAHAWQAWGVLESRAGNSETARELFEGGIRAVPTHSALWQAYGMMEMALGNTDKARKLLRAGIDRCRGHSSVVRLLQSWACFEVRDNEIDTARKLITEAIELEPHHGACWTVYAAIEEKVEDFETAREVYEKGIAADPKHGPLYRCYGTMEASLGRYSKARELFELGIKVAPYHAQLYHKYAELEAVLGNIEGLCNLNKKAQALFGTGKGRGEQHRAGRALRNISSIESYFDFVGENDHEADMEDLYEG